MVRKQTPQSGGIPPEEFEQAFGDGYWDLAEHQRFEMLVKRMLGQPVEKVTKEDARKRRQSEDVCGGAESGD